MDDFFSFKQKTAYDIRISDWSADVCSSDLVPARTRPIAGAAPAAGFLRRKLPPAPRRCARRGPRNPVADRPAADGAGLRPHDGTQRRRLRAGLQAIVPPPGKDRGWKIGRATV